MARQAREAAVRARLSPSQDAIVFRTGVDLIRGGRFWHLTDREADRLCSEWAERRRTLEAVSAVLSSEGD